MLVDYSLLGVPTDFALFCAILQEENLINNMGSSLDEPA